MARHRRTASSDSNVSFPPPYESSDDRPNDLNSSPLRGRRPTSAPILLSQREPSSSPPAYLNTVSLGQYGPYVEESDETEDVVASIDPLNAPERPNVSGGIHHPRVAVLLGVNSHWHKWLFICRLLCVLPELSYGIPLLWQIHRHAWALLKVKEQRSSEIWMHLALTRSPTIPSAERFDDTSTLLELILAAVWCATSGYLSFFCTDCLMARWLLYYTPPATLIRLVTASSFNYIVTTAILEKLKSRQDPRLQFPGWVIISAISILLYFYIHRRTAIKRANDQSVMVFGFASFASLCVLLGLVHGSRSLSG